MQLPDLRQAWRALGIRATGELCVAGAEALVDYQANEVIHHLFCGQCGVGSFSPGIAPSGNKMVAVNVRCLDGVDLSALTLTQVDGKKW